MTEYRLQLRAEFDRRILKNPRYSLRAFAGFLDMHPSALSRILANKQDLSMLSSVTVSRRLGLTENQQRLFLRSVINERSQKEFAELGKLVHIPMLRKPAFASTDPAPTVEREFAEFIDLKMRPSNHLASEQLLRDALEDFRDDLGGDLAPESGRKPSPPLVEYRIDISLKPKA